MSGVQQALLWGILSASGIAVAAAGACSSNGNADPPTVVTDGGAEARDAGASSDGGLPEAEAPRPSAMDLFANDALWKPVPGTKCLEGNVVPDPFPRRAWSSCGGGCTSSPTVLPFAESASFSSIMVDPAGSFIDGDVYVRLSMRSKLGNVAHLARLSDGATVAAVLDRGGMQSGVKPACVDVGFGGASPLLFSMSNIDSERLARATTEPGAPLAWHGSSFSFGLSSTERFDFDDGYGFGANSGVLLFDDPSLAVPKTLPGPGYVCSVHGSGKQLVWADAGMTAVRSYTRAGGTVDLVPVASPRHPLFVRLSSDRIVWVTQSGPPADTYTDVRWHWSPRSTDPSGITVHDGPSLPIVTWISDMHVSGDWAAVTGCPAANDFERCGIYVWNIGSGKTWFVPHRLLRTWRRIFAVTPTEIVLAEGTRAAGAEIDALVRIETSALDTLITGWKQ